MDSSQTRRAVTGSVALSDSSWLNCSPSFFFAQLQRTGFGEVGIGHHIDPLSGQGLGDVAAGDVLQPGKIVWNALGVLRNNGVRHTAWIERGEGDPRLPCRRRCSSWVVIMLQSLLSL